ncbi:conserved hypothetical protein [Desulfosarcina cetonica]|nr:conserved hypothetical protein [Desulfosarcina cetonica]
MHNLTDKMCPLMGKTCLLNGCTFFNEILDACEIGILSYNLYQLKEKIRAQLAHARETSLSIPPAYPEPPSGGSYPRPVR